jgi:hypothetical protein
MRRVITAGLAALMLAAGVSAQDYFQFQRRFQRAAKFATDDSFTGSFNFCRLFYTSVRSEYGGQGWWTDYPDADTNFMIRLAEQQDSGQPGLSAKSSRGQPPELLAARSSSSRTPAAVHH